MRVSSLSKAAVLWLALQQLGCTEDVRFNPSGCDVQVKGKWTVNGQLPTTKTCGDEGEDDTIDLVELAIINDKEDEFWSDNELLLDCAQEEVGTPQDEPQGVYLDSEENPRGRCGGSGEVLEDRTGPYKYRWRAITDLNFIVDCSPILEQEIEIDEDGTLVLNLPDVNFVRTEGGFLCPETN